MSLDSSVGSLWGVPPHCAYGNLCMWQFSEDIDAILIIQDPSLGPGCLPSNISALYSMALPYGSSRVLGYGGIDIYAIDGGRHYRTRESSMVSMEDTVSN